MKKIVFCFACILSLSLTAYAKNEDINSQKALAKIKAEPKVKDVLYDPSAAIKWHIGVLPDGTERYGYASYLCQVLKENSSVTPDTWVRIVDITKVINGVNFREASLGRVNCYTYEKQSP